MQERNFHKEGFHQLKFRSTDKVNNQEQEKESRFFVDERGPEIYVNFSIQKIREQLQDGKSFPVYPIPALQFK